MSRADPWNVRLKEPQPDKRGPRLSNRRQRGQVFAGCVNLPAMRHGACGVWLNPSAPHPGSTEAALYTPRLAALRCPSLSTHAATRAAKMYAREPRRHARRCGEHPRLGHRARSTKTWMAGTSPTMTAGGGGEVARMCGCARRAWTALPPPAKAAITGASGRPPWLMRPFSSRRRARSG